MFPYYEKIKGINELLNATILFRIVYNKYLKIILINNKTF